MKNIKIAIDAMGGDNAPFEIVKGAVEALTSPQISIVLVGKQNEIEEQLKQYKFDETRIKIVNATETIETDETPTTAIKKKKDSSMVVGLNLLKQKEVDAFVSAGSTGALLTGALLIVGRVKGIERPALGAMLPHANGNYLLLDVGANVDAKPSYLAQFAKMGSVYMETVGGIKNPKVGLLNIGAEKEKGNTLTKETYELLEQSGLNFIGNVEAREVPNGQADVIVCDAFVGNVVLKYTEGFASTLFSMLKTDLMGDFSSKIGALLAKSGFKRFKKRFNQDDVGGAPFLGVSGLVVKAHGSSNAKAINSAIKQCIAFTENEFLAKLEQKLATNLEDKTN